MRRQAVLCCGTESDVAAFPVEQRVYVRIVDTLWEQGTVREVLRHAEGWSIIVECDVRIGTDEDFYGGKGARIEVRKNAEFPLRNALSIKVP